MKQRCYNPNHPQYSNYGGRGISACDEWSNDFMAFKRWALSSGYEEHLTLDRVDNNGDYGPDNCRWATMRQQENNRSDNMTLTLNGKTQTLAEWSREIGMKYVTLFHRVYVKGMDADSALNTPVRERKMA